MKSPLTSMLPSATPHLLSLLFDTAKLRGMTAAERRISLARLASLLLQATGVTDGESDEGER